MHVIGLIADTHGLLATQVCPALAAAKVTHILHAGDVGPGKPKVGRLDTLSLLAALAEAAPVEAVRGNTDDGSGHNLPATLTYTAGGVRFIVYHGDDNRPYSPHWKDDEAVLAELEPVDGWRKHGDIIVSGHSHEPRFVRHASGVFFLNPGTAGGPTETKRFGKSFPQQLAIVRCGEATAATAFGVSAVDLKTGGSREWTAGDPSASPPAPPASQEAAAAASISRKRARQFAACDGGSRQAVATCSASASRPVSSLVRAEGEERILLGTIAGCFLKPARGAPMSRTGVLKVEACLGIAGDAHANRRSPRQVLLAASHEPIPGQPPVSLGSGLELLPGALRENLHVSLLPGCGAELWPVSSGRVLSIGTGGAALRISFACEPCAKGAERAGAELSELSRGWQRHAQRGLLATALRTGPVREGDGVWLLNAERFAPLANEHPARVRHILAKVPRGRVVPWNELAQLAGAPTGFSMRGMPGLLKKAAGMGAPSWRVVDSTWKIVPQHLPQQKQVLEEEGVETSEEGRVTEQQRVRWEPSHQELYWDTVE